MVTNQLGTVTKTATLSLASNYLYTKAQKSVDLRNFDPLPFSVGTATIDAEGVFKFEFTSPENAAFFRLEAR